MKLYVLVRKDLSKSQQAVQAGHSVAQWLLSSPDSSKWKNSTLVYLGVKNKKQLYSKMDELKSINKSFVEFREPDIGNQITSFAALDDGKIFKDLELLRL